MSWQKNNVFFCRKKMPAFIDIKTIHKDFFRNKKIEHKHFKHKLLTRSHNWSFNVQKKHRYTVQIIQDPF